MYTRLRVKYSLFLLAFNKFEFPILILEKWLRIAFYENTFSGGQTDTQADTERLLVAFRNVTNARRNWLLPSVFLVIVLHVPFFLYFSTITCIYFLLIHFSFIYSPLSSFLVGVFSPFLATLFPSTLNFTPLLHFSFSRLYFPFFHHFCAKNKYASSYKDAPPCTTPPSTLPSTRL